MRASRQKKRTTLLFCNAAAVCTLAAGYYHYEFDWKPPITIFQGGIPFVAFGLVLIRLVTFTEHILIDNAEIYSDCKDTHTAVLSARMRQYQTALMLGHVLLVLTLGIELLSRESLSVIASLLVLVVLQGAEAWSYWSDVQRERLAKSRPQSVV